MHAGLQARVTALAVLAAVALIGQLLLVLAVALNHRRTPDLEAEAPWDGPEAPRVLCVVPARNEERHIGACVEALLASRYPTLRVRVVDDGSTDRTAAIVGELAARDGRVELLTAPPLPPGWLGKNHALFRGAHGATAAYLLFVDADLRAGPEALARVVGAAERSGADLLTMVPRLEVGSFWERAVQPLVGQLIFALVPVAEVNDPGSPRAAGLGPFLLFRRSAYERVGGHQAVRGAVVEDLALAERIKKAGLRLVYARGVRLASLRMYDSLGAIVRGWAKNFHTGLGGARWAAPLAAAALLVVLSGPLVLPVLAAAAGARAALGLGLLAAAAQVAGRLDLSRRYRIPAASVLLAPLGGAVVAWILVRSALAAARGRPFEWKGRKVA